jgi:hypothetical protein
VVVVVHNHPVQQELLQQVEAVAEQMELVLQLAEQLIQVVVVVVQTAEVEPVVLVL